MYSRPNRGRGTNFIPLTLNLFLRQRAWRNGTGAMLFSAVTTTQETNGHDHQEYGHDHQECSTRGLGFRLPDRDRDLADGRRVDGRTRRLWLCPPRQVRMAMAPRQALMGMVRRRALMSRRASMSRRRPRQARPGPS